MAVDEARDHAAAVGVEARIRGDRPGALHRDDAVAVDHERGVAHHAERSGAERGIVGDEQTDAVDDERRHERSAPMAESNAAGTSIVTWLPSRTITRPPLTTWRTSAAVAANTTASSA